MKMIRLLGKAWGLIARPGVIRSANAEENLDNWSPHMKHDIGWPDDTSLGQHSHKSPVISHGIMVRFDR